MRAYLKNATLFTLIAGLMMVTSCRETVKENSHGEEHIENNEHMDDDEHMMDEGEHTDHDDDHMNAEDHH